MEDHVGGTGNVRVELRDIALQRRVHPSVVVDREGRRDEFNLLGTRDVDALAAVVAVPVEVTADALRGFAGRSSSRMHLALVLVRASAPTYGRSHTAPGEAC